MSAGGMVVPTLVARMAICPAAAPAGLSGDNVSRVLSICVSGYECAQDLNKVIFR